MKILMPCMALPPFLQGGGPITALNNAKNLTNHGHDVLVVHAADEDESDTVDGVPVRRIKSPNVYWNYREPHAAWKKLLWHGLENYNPRAEKAMSEIIEEFNPDVVVTFSTENVNTGTWRAAHTAGVPCVHQACSSFLICWKASMMRNGKSCDGQCKDCYLTSLGKRYLSQVPQGLVGETAFIVDAHTELGYFSNADTLVLPGSMPPVEGAKANVRETGEGLKVGFLGELAELKAPDLLAKASHLMGDRKVEYFLGGKSIGEYGETIKSMFREGTAHFLGWTDPKAFLQSVDMLVLPSRGSEVFGRVLIEAYANGIPVIGSDMGGIPETIEHGKSGYVFPSEDAATLADHLKMLHDDVPLYNDMAAYGMKKSANYTPDVWSASMTQWLDKIVSQYHSARTAA
jgi:glycosyltransferase involved in cell wall biosynthesis